MEDVSPSDLFEIRKESLFASCDDDFLYGYYAPIAGLRAIGIFLALRRLPEGQKRTHEAFFAANQLSAGEFVNAMKPLEALGLVATYRHKGEGSDEYVYCLYAPKTPKEFFENVLLVGTLRRYLPKEECERIAEGYRLAPLPDKPFEDVSERFTSYFAPDFDAPAYRDAAIETGGRGSAPIHIGFDRNAFFAALKAKDGRLGEDALSQEELVRIARLSALYAYEEEAMADFLVASYDFKKPFGSRADFAKLSALAEESLRFAYGRKTTARPSGAHGEEPLAKMLRKMDSSTPLSFLTFLQKGNKPAKADLRLLEELVVEMGLPAPVCNALIFYVLKVKDDVLSSAYVTKLAGSLVRKGIATSLDALNYLGKNTPAAPKGQKGNGHLPAEATAGAAAPEPSPKEEPEKAMSDEEYEAILDGYAKKGGKKR